MESYLTQPWALHAAQGWSGVGEGSFCATKADAKLDHTQISVK